MILLSQAKTKGNITIEQVVILVIALVVLVILLIYSGILRGESSSIFDRILGLLTRK